MAAQAPLESDLPALMPPSQIKKESRLLVSEPLNEVNISCENVNKYYTTTNTIIPGLVVFFFTTTFFYNQTTTLTDNKQHILHPNIETPK